MSFDVKGEILAQISKTGDENLRVVLLLMLGVLDASIMGVEKISNKIDNLVNDEVTLRKAVLNELEANHEADHFWISDHKKQSEINMQILSRANRLIPWAEKKILEEEEASRNKKSLFMKALEAIVSQTGTIITTAIAVYLGIKVF